MRTLYYVADPMCSWCFGFAPVLAEVRAELGDEVKFQLVLGGLAPDSDEPMTEETLRYVQGAWRAVEERSGVAFNHEFWSKHHPKRSTWPACRAVIAAGERGEEMFAAIQKAYYREARDPSDRATLVELAGELGLDVETFDRALDAPATHARLREHFELRDRLGATGFPSVGIGDGDDLRLVTRGWAEADELRAAVQTVPGRN